MDELIEDIVAYAEKKIRGYSYSGQSTLYDELGGKFDEMSAEALKNDYYYGSDDYEHDV